MIPTSRTSIVYNNPNKIIGLPESYYRLRKCDTNLTSNTPANQYQRLKLIQNTVRVYASLYTANVGPLAAYQQPGIKTHNVCWNQMSDRAVPSVQKHIVPSGTNCSLNRKTTSVTSSRPGGQSPGGVGCDIKHNSYDRYLNRLKGKGPLRRGVIPSGFGVPVLPFNRAYPIYGAKTTKTNIVNGCFCPIPTNEMNIQESGVYHNVNGKSTITTKQDVLNDSEKIYNNPLYHPYPESSYIFHVGEYVFAIQPGHNFYTRATILEKDNSFSYLIKFDNGIKDVQSANRLLIYYPCNCNGQINQQIYPSGFLVVDSTPSEFYPTCLYPNYIPGQPLL
jgi:hypothetical protein